MTVHVPAQGAIRAAVTLGLLALVATAAQSATTVQIGASGKTFASASPACVVNPATGLSTPQVQAGLFNPRRTAVASVSLNGVLQTQVNALAPVADVWLADGVNTVTVALSRKVSDSYRFDVAPGLCSAGLPPGNHLSADGSLEIAASGKSSLTVVPGCALNPATGQAQPFVNLFDNGSYLLNVSVNGVALTQLSATRPRALIFLGAGRSTITAANGTLSTDLFYREGGLGSCTLP